jgi:methyl-accepting chemotaxis protein
MGFLSCLSVRTRQLWLAIIGIAVLCLCVVVALHGSGRLQQSSEVAFVAKDVVADVLPPPMYLIELRLVLSRRLDGTLSDEQVRREVERLASEYDARVTYWRANPPFGLERQLLGDQHEASKAFIAAAQHLVNEAAAGRDAAELAALLRAADALYLKHRAAVDVTVKSGLELAERSMADFTASADTARLSLLLLLVGGVALLGVAALWIGRSIVGPLQEAVTLVEAVSRGDLTLSHPARGRDESARLLKAVNVMSVALASLVKRLQQSSAALASSSTELASGHGSLSARAAALNAETTSALAALQEINGFVTTNAAAAQSARTLSEESASVAAKGMTAVQQVTRAMDGLAQSTQSVGGLVGLIQSIAFQTNLLALNAAVEAARAGEQGRGFAVVAAEVRHLADRSAQSAAQIRSVVDSNSAVVAEGHGSVVQARDAIEHLVGCSARMGDLVREIWETTYAQSSGLNLLIESMDDLKGSAQENMVLAEQTGRLAHDLEDVASTLTDVSAGFKVPAAA